ncbi:MAG: hypothetical protein ACLPWG_17645, partial [Steroidobacteraceae bacterium]
SGLYLTSSPIFTVNWYANPASQMWTVPMGGGVGKLFKIGPHHVVVIADLGVHGQPADFANTWQIRAQVQLMFPK